MTRLEAIHNALGAMLNAELTNMGTIKSVTEYHNWIDLSIHFEFGDPYKYLYIKQLKSYLLEDATLSIRFDAKGGYSVLHINWKF